MTVLPIGHSRPPDDDEDEPIDEALLAECEEAIACGDVDVGAPIPYVLTSLGRGEATPDLGCE